MRRSIPFLFAVLFAACAQIREPVGGVKDELPPILLSAEPVNGSVRFTGDRIVLHFNERVKLDRLRERLLVSPPLDPPPVVQVMGGRDVVIELKAPLQRNTTYTFNFNGALVDLTEGNASPGFSYVISTGDVLDSLSVSGQVNDAFTADPAKELWVMLYADTDTTAFTKGRPAYCTRTDATGKFTLRNLPVGRFGLHALKDQNANYRYDLPNERIAFLDSVITTTDTLSHRLHLFLGAAPQQHVLEAAVQPDRSWRMIMAKPADTLLLAQLDRTGGALTWSTEWSASRDTVLFWPGDTTLLTDQRFAISDTAGVVDTVSYRVVRKMPFYVDLKTGGSAEPGKRLLVSSRPLKAVRAERIELRSDSAVLNTTWTIDPAMRRHVLYDVPINGSTSAVLTLLPGAVEDIYGGRNDTVRLTLGPQEVKVLGDLTIRLTEDSLASRRGPFILQILSAQGSLVYTERCGALPHTVERTGMPAGAYTLKLIQDLDGDGHWTTGSFPARRQPEPVFRQAGTVEVRAGWQVGVDWKLSGR
jgi:uncharacterized protein (DUF2141 family)